jgi:hypothetical protein
LATAVTGTLIKIGIGPLFNIEFANHMNPNFWKAPFFFRTHVSSHYFKPRGSHGNLAKAKDGSN